MRNDRFLGIGIVVLGLVIFFSTQDFPGADSNRPGPAFLPRLLAGLLMICGAFLAIARPKDENTLKAPPGAWKDILFVLAVLAVYVLIVDRTGFLIAGGALTMAVCVRLKNGWQTSLLASIVLTLGTYALFSTLLGVMLPIGWLGW